MDFKELPRYYERQFLSDSVDFNDFDEIEGYYKLLNNAIVDNKELFEIWIQNRSELDSALDQHAAILYIRMTCQTDDEKKAEEYRNFIENISPKLKLLDFDLDKKFLKFFDAIKFDHDKYDLFKKSIKVDVDLFKEENIDLETQVDLISQEYQTLYGSMTVDYKQKTYTLPQINKFLQDVDRSVREEVWLLKTNKLLENAEKFNVLFNRLMNLRNQIAKNAGFENYIDFRFKELHRFDYTVKECKTYHNSIEEVIVPIYKEILEKRKDQLKLDSLKPWDLSVDPCLKPALKPFGVVSELTDGCQRIFNKIDCELSQYFKQMIDLKTLDLESRKGKAPGGYQQTLNESRMPFIFMNAVGLDSDLRTLLHEAGHSFHAFESRDQEPMEYRHAPMEFCEVASMSMELFGGEYLNEFYSEDEVKRSNKEHLEDIVYVLIWVAIIDSFQHWIYENPDHTIEQRTESWLNIRKRFGFDSVDWSGLRHIESILWHSQLHIFEVPFYYIEYGIAQLGALQLFKNFKSDQSKTINDYKTALSYGGSKCLPELFEYAHIKFAFSENIISALADFLKVQLDAFNEK